MTSAVFSNYMKKGFVPLLEKLDIPRPVVVFVDGHGSHMSLEVSEFCDLNGIVLVALYPNATNIIQPMDVAVFHPMKQKWRAELKAHVFQSAARNPINRSTFAGLLENVLNKVVKPSLYESGFRACGLYPF